LLFAGALAGRSQDGSLTGAVIDAGGWPVPGAVVTLRSAHTKPLTLAIRTKKDGRFTFSKVAPQDYELCVGALGFRARCLSSFKVEPGEKKSLARVTLQLSGCCGGVSIAPVPPPE